MNSDIIIWLHDNKFGIIYLITPLINQKKNALQTYDVIFHDEINKQFKSLYLSLIGIEASAALGCSAEDFYETVEDENVIGYLNELIQEGENEND
jgi:hypothetical protein